MAKQTVTTIVAAIIMTLSFTAHTFAGTHENLVRTYIKLSGFNDLISSFPDQLSSISAQRLLTSERPDLERKITTIMKESFDVKRAQESLFTFLLQNTQIDFLEKEVQWGETPLAKKIQAEETAASRPEAQAGLLRYMADLQENPPSEARIAIIHEFEKTTGLSDLSTQIIIEMMRGMIESANLALPEDKRQTQDQVEEEIEKIRPTLRDAMRENMILTSLYTYRNISDGELTQYIEFYKSDTGKTEIDISGKALAHVLKQWIVIVGEKITALAIDNSASTGTSL